MIASASSEAIADDSAAVPRTYAWIVFVLTFGLLLSDYMSRQVLNAVFPILKAEWGLLDSELGRLSGVVSLTVGLFAFPLSIAADRWGRVRSLVLMAFAWSLATLACGFAQDFGQMMAARFFVGLGEAAYGSVGLAVVLSLFPMHMRATLTGAFLAGGMFGSVFGVSLGGIIAEQIGWRAVFHVMAAVGLALAALYLIIVRDRRPSDVQRTKSAIAPVPLISLFSTPAIITAYVGSGLQLFAAGSVIAWGPSFLNRYHGLAPDKAGVIAALILLASGFGMIVCGSISDKLAKRAPQRMPALAIAYCIASFAILSLAFRLPPSQTQIVLIGAGMFLAAGATGPAGAMVANLAHASRHGAALAVLSLANNLLGMAPGPILTGEIADRAGLAEALQYAPFASLAAAFVFFLGSRDYARRLKT